MYGLLQMERLSCSNSAALPKIHLHPFSTIFSRLVTHRRLASFSSSSSPFPSIGAAAESWCRLNPVSCNLHDTPFVSCKETSDDCRQKKLAPSVEELETESVVLKLLSLLSPHRRKLLNAGRVVFLSAVILMLLYPATTLPALASFPGAAIAANPAGSSALRTELLSSAWTGFLAGCLHTLSGPDHLAALAPLSIGRSKMESAVVGALWGCGHDAGQLIFGLFFLLLKDRLHIEIIRTWGTRVVGLTLLVIGAMGIREASEVPTPCVTLENGECDVSAAYESATASAAISTQSITKKKIGFATFATGIIHGLQPDALMMILPALALPSRLAGAAFLLMFLFGTVIAMGSYTIFIGSCSEALKDRVPRVTEKLTWASSVIAIGVGLAILISQFLGFSLY